MVLQSFLSACSIQVTAPVSVGVKTGLTATSRSYKDEMCGENTEALQTSVIKSITKCVSMRVWITVRIPSILDH